MHLVLSLKTFDSVLSFWVRMANDITLKSHRTESLRSEARKPNNFDKGNFFLITLREKSLTYQKFDF